MWNNLRILTMKNILTMRINFIRRSMGLRKLLEHSMYALGTFSLTMVLGLVNLTQLFLQEK
jgi:hypothetical protein